MPTIVDTWSTGLLGGMVGIPTHPPSVNLFVTRLCNYECRFCFATFPDLRSSMPRDEALAILRQLAQHGVEKVTFVGGEPTLLPWLPDAVRHASELGMVTCIVSNASRLSDDLLQELAGHLDWLAVSIDASSDDVEAKLGRGRGQHVAKAVQALQRAKALGIRTKLNTVVTALNWQDDLSPVLEAIRPDRWKAFQMLPVRGQNDGAADLLITPEQFEAYKARHAAYMPVAEDNDDMTDSYVMIDPEGRIFQNTGGTHVYGPKVLEVGFDAALATVGWDAAKFLVRGGLYEWSRRTPQPSNSPRRDGTGAGG